MELCGFAQHQGVGSIYRPEHANRQNKRLNGQADRLNGFSVEISATRTGVGRGEKRPVLARLKPIVCEAFRRHNEAWLYLRREALRHHRGLTRAGAGTHSATSFAQTTGPVASQTSAGQTKADPLGDLRPVTPEVAGSSPVAPVSRSACKSALVVACLGAASRTNYTLCYTPGSSCIHGPTHTRVGSGCTDVGRPEVTAKSQNQAGA